MVASKAASLLPLSVLNWANGKLALPYYHFVSDEPAPHVENLYRFRGIREFESDLEFFLRHFEPISAELLLSCAEGKGALPASAFLLTFDDGFREMHDVVAPILKRRGIPAVFFINSSMHDNRELCMHQKVSLLLDLWKRQPAKFPAEDARALLAKRGLSCEDPLERLRNIPWSHRDVLDEIGVLAGCDYAAFLHHSRPYLETAQVRSMMAQGFEFGGHSIDHPLYEGIALQEQLRQTRESVAFVCETFQSKRKLFAFPHTDRGVSRQFFEIVQAEGTVEATFGTSGPGKDCVGRSYQRFSMEKTSLAARAILARQAMKGIRSRMTGRGTLVRK